MRDMLKATLFKERPAIEDKSNHNIKRQTKSPLFSLIPPLTARQTTQ